MVIFQMRIVDIFLALKHRSRVHISEQAGLCRTWSESRRKFFLLWLQETLQHKMGYSCILLLVLIELRHKKAWPEVIKLFHV